MGAMTNCSVINGRKTGRRDGGRPDYSSNIDVDNGVCAARAPDLRLTSKGVGKIDRLSCTSSRFSLRSVVTSDSMTDR